MDNPIRTNPQTETEHFPHTGSRSVPENLRERPVEESDIPLRETIQKTPTSATPLVGEEASAAPEKNKEKKKSKRGLMIGIGGAAAAVAVAAGAAFTVNAMNSNNQSEVPAMPSDPAGVENEEPVPADPEIIAQMKALSAEQFAELSQTDEQLPYVYYRIEANLDNHESLVAGWSNERPAWTEPSREMDDQAILDNVLYVIDDAELSVDMSTGVKLLDKTEANKKLYGAFYDAPNTDIMSDYFWAVRDEIEERENTFLTDNSWEAISSTELQTGNDLANNPIEYKDITFTAEDGNEYVGRFVYKDFTSVDSEEKSAWLLEYYTAAN